MTIRAFSISALINTIKMRPRLLISIVVGQLSIAAISADWQWPQLQVRYRQSGQSLETGITVDGKSARKQMHIG